MQSLGKASGLGQAGITTGKRTGPIPNTWVGPGSSLNPKRWEFTLKTHLKAIFTAFWHISEYWNPAAAWKVASMLTQTLFPPNDCSNQAGSNSRALHTANMRFQISMQNKTIPTLCTWCLGQQPVPSQINCHLWRQSGNLTCCGQGAQKKKSREQTSGLETPTGCF